MKIYDQISKVGVFWARWLTDTSFSVVNTDILRARYKILISKQGKFMYNPITPAESNLIYRLPQQPVT